MMGTERNLSTPCETCHGKGFVNPDGTSNNAFEGNDHDPVVPCPDCRVPVDAIVAAYTAVARPHLLRSLPPNSFESVLRRISDLSSAGAASQFPRVPILR